VSVTLNNRTVPGSPFKVHAWPHELFLPLSRMFGDGLYSCTAGKPAQVTVLARDLSGTPLAAGGAALKLTVEQNQLTVSGE
jgi:hypothetical protein